MLIDDTVHFFAYLLTSLVVVHVLKSAPDTRIQQIDQYFYYPIFNVLNLFPSIIVRTLFIKFRVILYTVRALPSGFWTSANIADDKSFNSLSRESIC